MTTSVSSNTGYPRSSTRPIRSKMCALFLSVSAQTSRSYALSFAYAPLKSATATRTFSSEQRALFALKKQCAADACPSGGSPRLGRILGNFGRSNSGAFGLGRLASTSGMSIARPATLAPLELELKSQMDVTHDAFELVRKDVVEEYGAYCSLYRHVRTGAEVLSVSADDDNKVFGITFRTPPNDSTGVPHVLEHSVLCGSRKYPTKEPFVELIKGSLNTFLNAFTYPDRTCYPVASQNTKDFYNLINVYLDAVLHPRCVSDPMVLAQEGWHLELEDKDEPLTYKGVVYNEMKGVYSSSDSLLTRESMRSLFPDTTYGVDSGGDPAIIPTLSFEAFRSFHEKFYHPGNSRIFFYGDDHVEDRLRIIDEYLSEFEASPTSKLGSTINWQKKIFDKPRKEIHPYPAGADQPEHMINVNWLLNDAPFTAFDELALNLLDHLLVGTSSSTLYKALMESGLGDAITGGGLSDELLQGTFSIGLKGIQPENVEAVEKLVFDVLKKAAEEGFAEDDIAASMNTVEFTLREFNTGSFPKGLSFMLGAMSKWIYGADPTEALKFEQPLAELKASIAASGSKVFQELIQKLLIENNHRVTIEMVPSKTMEDEQVKEEQSRLKKIKDSLSEEEVEGIMETTKELKRLQAAEDSPESVATIPSLELEDLNRKTKEYPIEVDDDDVSGVKIIRHELSSTSGIAYVDFGVDLSSVPLSDAPLLSLLTRLMIESGTTDLTDVELSRKIGTHTGGINANIAKISVEPEGAEEFAVVDGMHMMTKMFIRGKSTADNCGELFDLMTLILTDTDLDVQKKVIEILKEKRSGIESNIQGAGHSYANMRIQSRYGVSGHIEEALSGISSLDITKELLAQAEDSWPAFLSRLEGIRANILSSSLRSGALLNLTGDKKVMSIIKPQVDTFLGGLPGSSDGEKVQNFYKVQHPWAIQAAAEMEGAGPLEDEGFIVPTQVSYVGKGGRLYDIGDKVSGAAMVASRYLRNTYLWDQVRVIGGAYGGFCTFDPKSGLFTFLSYRDPNLATTIDAYDGAGDALAEAAEELADRPEVLAKAIIGMVGDLDGALSADQKGWVSMQRYLGGEAPETRQARRDQILETTAEDFRDFAKRLKGLGDPSVAVVSSKGQFEASGKVMKLTELL
mmetsp:Transcript_20376/g.40720  ORF Transcript_20376/g.40720 Transcript_20376/m.40720 type:complete len:1138 (-) Transcript_20376:45-3458(-)